MIRTMHLGRLKVNVFAYHSYKLPSNDENQITYSDENYSV